MILSTIFFLYFCSFTLQCNVLFEDVCFDSCPLDTHPQQTLKGIECFGCDITRNLILDDNNEKCICSLGTFSIQDQSQCYPCHYSCLTCTGPNYNQCLTCDTQIETTFRVKQNQGCVCIAGYFDNYALQSTRCEKCHKDCSSCTGPEDKDCIQCSNGKIKNQFNQCICEKNFLNSENGECYCPYKVSPDGTCKNPVNQCPPNQQVVKLTSIAKAGKKGGPFTCECIDGFYRIKGVCKTCGENEVYKPSTRRCQCIKNSYKYKKRCIVCGINQIFNKKQVRCICKKNLHQTQSGDCIKCPPKTIYSNGQCVCVFNFYLDPENNKCRRCSRKAQHPSCVQDIHNFDIALDLDVQEVKYGPKSRVKTYLKNVAKISRG